MSRNPSMRASDTERETVTAALQEHCAQGRLTVEEFQERMEQAYVAKTLGELDRLTEDLPAEDLYQLPVPAKQQVSRQNRHSGLSQARTDVEQALPGGMWIWLWGSWVSAGVLAMAGWLLLWMLGLDDDAGVYYTWACAGVLVPWGVVQLAAHAAERGRRRP